MSAASEEALRALVDWTRPRGGLHWLVIGQASDETLRQLLDLTVAARLTYIVESEDDKARMGTTDERVTVRVDEYASLRGISGVIDASLSLGALEQAATPYRVVSALARVTRLYGTVAAIENNALDRRTLWDWWLDARINDVVSREFENYAMVRGTR